MTTLDKDWTLNLAERIRFPQEAVACMSLTADRILRDPDAIREFSAVYETIIVKETQDMNALESCLQTLSRMTSIPVETLCMLFLLNASRALLDRYRAAGIRDEIFYQSMTDYTPKLLECKNVRGIWGTFVSFWYAGFFNLHIFRLGRFEYELAELPEDYRLPDGRILSAGRFMAKCHIPSGQPSLTDEVRMASYKEAYGFFADRNPDGLLVIGCSSWLLYGRHPEFLPENSHILRFMSDFDLLGSRDLPEFGDSWRLYGSEWTQDYEKLPEKTAMQRAYKKWLLNGNCAGSGFGLLVFDGEKIINRR